MVTQYCGGIAQLGERLNGIQEVSGSIPLTSTKIISRDCTMFKVRRDFDGSVTNPVNSSGRMQEEDGFSLVIRLI